MLSGSISLSLCHDLYNTQSSKEGKLEKADAQLSGLLEPMQNWDRAVLEKEVELRRRAQALLALPVRMPSHQAPLLCISFDGEKNVGG